MKKIIYSLFLVFIFSCTLLFAEAPSVRVKDVATVLGARDNQIIGFGLVVGLHNSGDSTQVEFTKEALTNLLNRMGVSGQQSKYQAKNVAAVMVTLDLPAFVQAGQRLDVVVSSIGDAKSLQGGSLISTPLMGADGKVYAVAQGKISMMESDDTGNKRKSMSTSGVIADGGLVERTIPSELSSDNFLTLVLKKADFTTAARLAYALELSGFGGVKAIDGVQVKVPIGLADRDNIVGMIARIEEVYLVPDQQARVVINEKTGTIVIGENVRLAPAAITHNDISISIQSDSLGKSNDQFIYLRSGAHLHQLVKALNKIGISPKELIAILHALKNSGSLIADLEII